MNLPLSQPKSFLYGVKCQTLVDFRSIYFNVVYFPLSEEQRFNTRNVFFIGPCELHSLSVQLGTVKKALHDIGL